jgi:hypothetical protein
MRRFLILCAVGLSTTVLASSPFAALIAVTQTGTGEMITGSLDGLPFSTTGFTILSTGDTNNREFHAGTPSLPTKAFAIVHDGSSIAIDGVGTVQVFSPTRTFVNNDVAIVGYSRWYPIFSGGVDLYNGPQNSVFSTWDMLTSVGPIPGPMRLFQWTYSYPSGFSIETDHGVLMFDTQGIQGTFQAVVPEPSTFPLLWSGVIGLGFYRWRRRRWCKSM